MRKTECCSSSTPMPQVFESGVSAIYQTKSFVALGSGSVVRRSQHSHVASEQREKYDARAIDHQVAAICPEGSQSALLEYMEISVMVGVLIPRDSEHPSGIKHASRERENLSKMGAS